MTDDQRELRLPGPRTAPGRGTAQPDGLYEPPPAVRSVDGEALTVQFKGRDGRGTVFSFDGLPLPELHEDLARAFAARFGKNEINTITSARTRWAILARFLRFLGSLPRPPRDISELTGAQLKRYRMHVKQGTTDRSLVEHFRGLHGLLRKLPSERLRPEVSEAIRQVDRLDRRQIKSKPGYDDATFHQIVTTTRSAVVDIYKRIRTGEALLARFEADPGQMTSEELERAAELALIAKTGRIPYVPVACTGRVSSNLPNMRARVRTAQQLFLTHRDIVPLIVLGVAITGRNSETIKELPAEHRLLDGRAVALEIVKRRRGADRWFEEVTWDAGRPSERLKSAGGYYLFVERLARRGRQFSGSPLVWSIWTNGNRDEKKDTGGHKNPFGANLELGYKMKDWVATQPELRDLPGFELDMNRLKTTVDRRNTRAAGGHLPSSTRSNTQDVLFRNYLAGDPDVLDWAGDVITEALEDAEDAARTAYLKAREAQGQLKVLTQPVDEARHDPAAAGASIGLDEDTAREVLDGERDTAFAACAKPTDDCRDSFLTCFACRNAVATSSHLPAQLGLLDELAELWEGTDRDTWWRKFGQVWLAINEDILPRFTPQERAAAELAKTTDRVLHLIEGPREDDSTWV